MAKQSDNNATHGIRGKVNLFVYRQRYGETIASKVPVRTAAFSETQLGIQATFKMAVLYAKAILQNPAIRQAYQAKAKRGQTAFNRAVADFFKIPVISDVDLTQLTNQAGSSILAMVTDDFRVESVKVKIEKANGAFLEEGNAVPEQDGLHWKYTVTSTGANGPGNKVTITATDLPGHSIVEQKTI